MIYSSIYNNNYQYNNLFDCVCCPNTKVDTLEYQMAEPDGTLLGNGFTDKRVSCFLKRM
jgi:hypothetical protein